MHIGLARRTTGAARPGSVFIFSIHFQVLDEVSENSIALADISRHKLGGVLANFSFAFGAEGDGRILTAGDDDGFDVRLGEFKMVLESEEAIFESERLIFAEGAGAEQRVAAG
jgi:hypothetical protein